jgi:hypothetical protein
VDKASCIYNKGNKWAGETFIHAANRREISWQKLDDPTKIVDHLDPVVRQVDRVVLVDQAVLDGDQAVPAGREDLPDFRLCHRFLK